MNNAQKIHEQAQMSKYAIDNLIAYIKHNCPDEMWKDVAIEDLRNIKGRQDIIMTKSKEVLDTYFNNNVIPNMTTEA